jgi:hypothetical protein
MRPSVLAARVSRAARRSRVVFHHLGKCLDPRGKAETFETRRHFASASILTALAGSGGCDKPVHGVAFLSWNQHPEPTSSRRATPLLLFQQSPGHALQLLDSAQVVVRGPKPATVLHSRKVRIDRAASDPFTTTRCLPQCMGPRYAANASWSSVTARPIVSCRPRSNAKARK